MEFLQSQTDIFKRASPSKASKRFLSLMIDALLVIVMGYGLFCAGFYGIVSNSEGYTALESKVKDEISYYNDLVEETHLVTFEKDANNNKVRVDENNDILCINTIRGFVRNSYDLAKSGGDSVGYDDYWKDLNVTSEELDGNADKSNAYLGDGETFATNPISYFYTSYVPAHNTNNDFIDFKGKDSKNYYVYDVFRATLGKSYIGYFSEIKSDSITYPRLKAEYASLIFKYLIRGENGDGKNIYSDLYTLIDNMENDAENVVLYSHEYYNNHYQKYVEYKNEQASMVIKTLAISFIISYLIVVLPFAFILKDDLTLGRKFLKLGVIGKNNEPTKWYISLIRGALGCIGFLPATILIGVLPPFGGSFVAFNQPIFYMGSFGFTYMILLIIILVFDIANGILVLLTHYHTSLIDIITRQRVVDSTHLDEEDCDDRDEGSL